MRRLVRLVAAFISKVCSAVARAVLRAVITAVVFTTCLMVMLHYLGIPVPRPSELLDKFEDLGRLARILS